MCGDIMITKNKTKKQSSSHILVVTIMCAVVMTIVGQSLTNYRTTYAENDSNQNGKLLTETHGIAPNTTDIKHNIVDQLQILVDEQKQIFDKYVLWSFVSNNTIVETWSWSVESWSFVWSVVNISPVVSEYESIEVIRKTLLDKHCDYSLPIDTTDLKLVEHLQRWLEHCLITVSSNQKVYPDNILTHSMMRTIAQRAWFIVKMDYASDKPVSRNQLLAFLYALQQHHTITDIPVVPLSNPVKRSEYLVLLHKLFWDKLWWSSISSWIILTGWVFSTWSVIASNTITLKDVKEVLISQGYTMEIMPYDSEIIVTPEIMKKMLADSPSIHKSIWNSNTIGVDKEMLKQTLSRLMEKI